jgi:gas vesicle protein
MTSGDCIKGFIIGSLTGAALGILYAPKSGKKMREKILNSAESVLEQAKEQCEEALKTIDKLASEEKELYKEKIDKLRKALEMALQAFT